MKTMNLLEEHPKIGVLATILSIFTSWLLEIKLSDHIPALIMDSIQVFVWLLGGLAALASLHGWYKKQFKSNDIIKSKKK